MSATPPPILTLETLEDHIVFVEGGTFMMGSEDGYGREKPAHEVRLDDFYLCRYLVTQALWEEVMLKNPSQFSHPARPVESVSWNDCQVFLKRLNEKSEYTYRLPTEAEWEYAAIGGKYQRPSTFAGSDNLHEVDWHEVKSGNSHDISQPTGLKRVNPLGLYDMSGNLREWCQDRFDEAYYQECLDNGISENPSGPGNVFHRVVRGGSLFLINDLNFRPAVRNGYSSFSRGDSFGLRLSRY